MLLFKYKWARELLADGKKADLGQRPMRLWLKSKEVNLTLRRKPETALVEEEAPRRRDEEEEDEEDDDDDDDGDDALTNEFNDLILL